MCQIRYYFDKSECLNVVISSINKAAYSFNFLSSSCVYVCAFRQPARIIRDVTLGLAAADHAKSRGFDICAAGNLVRSVVNLWLL